MKKRNTRSMTEVPHEVDILWDVISSMSDKEMDRYCELNGIDVEAIRKDLLLIIETRQKELRAVKKTGNNR